MTAVTYPARHSLAPLAGLASAALLVIALAVATTTGLGFGASWLDEQRMICTVALCAAVLVLMLPRGRPTGRAAALLLCVASLGLASALRAKRPELALYDWSLYVLLAYWAMSMRFEDARWRAFAAAAFGAIPATAYGAAVLANYVSSWLVAIPVGDGTFLAGFSNPRFPAQLEALTLPFLYVAFREAPSRGWRMAAGCVAAVWWMCLIGSGSRTAFIALLVAAAVLLVAGPACRRSLTWQLRFALIGALLYALLFLAVPKLAGVAPTMDAGHLFYASSVQARVELARIAIEMALNHPLLGVGPMHFAFPANEFGAHPHNFWLQLAAEWGVMAATIVGLVVALLAVRLLRAARAARDDTRSSSLIAASLAALVIWVVGTQADGYMVIPTSQIASAFVLMFASQAYPASGRALPQEHGVALLWRGLAVLALAALAWLPFSSFGAPTAREVAWRAAHPQAAFWPRFWQQGWIGPDHDPAAATDKR